ncbi:hypothetical protein IKK_05456 [Bacillus mycoides]|uniref:Uncharacterized protein n=1 Tax=Bacillus mycoides TaxID=1405 RepID=A0AAP8KUV0_BACMY|nr:hypothetical protein BG05_5551 [Bacillus mycoides]EJR99355.1 hypothetical protein IKO_05316 [Bacillus cereus VDM034]EJS11429.1 hypothetical protein IKS_05537 [Bacillus cereus VDM062]MBJ7960312.1 hypothetical protein [Bacillus cereus group sp. N28]EOO34651.1 hypothetical protein IKK_05456 [Bacillus mycoides]
MKRKLWFWCKNRIKDNKAHRFLTESYLMLQVQTIDGRILSDFGQTGPVNQPILF